MEFKGFFGFKSIDRIEMVRIDILRFLLLVFALQLGTSGYSQQLPQFSQYIFNGLHINPGYAGYKNEGYVQSTFRSQWVGLAGAPRTLSVSADLSANEGQMGFGVSYTRDKIGLTESNLGLLTYSYRINTSDKGRLALGVSAGISENVFDPSSIVTVNPDDSSIPEGRISAIEPRVNTGVFYHDDLFYAGISAYNLLGSKVKPGEIAASFNDAHYFFTAGGMFYLNDYFQIKPSILLSHSKGSPTSYDLNVMGLFYEKLWIGGSFRSNFRVLKDELQEKLIKRNAIAFVMEYFVTTGIRLGYSYDYNLNALNSVKNQSHELSMGVYLKGKKEIVYNPRWF